MSSLWNSIIWYYKFSVVVNILSTFCCIQHSTERHSIKNNHYCILICCYLLSVCIIFQQVGTLVECNIGTANWPEIMIVVVHTAIHSGNMITCWLFRSLLYNWTQSSTLIFGIRYLLSFPHSWCLSLNRLGTSLLA